MGYNRMDDDEHDNESFEVGFARCTDQRKKGEKITAIFVESSTVGKKGVWIPYSVVSDDSEVWNKGSEGNLIVAAWFANTKGWR